MGVLHKSRGYGFDEVPGHLPQARLPENLSLDQVGENVVRGLPALLREDNIVPDGLWRDLLSFTNHFRTISTAASISKAYTALSKLRRPTDFEYDSSLSAIMELSEDTAWVDVGFRFTTNNGIKANNAGIVSVLSDHSVDGGWRIWVLRTWLEGFEGHGNADRLASAVSSSNGHAVSTSDQEESVYDAVIVGAGQAGLSTAGRLKALGCSYMVLERNGNIGQNWTDRYDSLRWHTSKEYGNLPFDHTYLPEDDYQLTTKMIGSGFARWVERHHINVKTNTAVQKAEWNSSSQLWTITTSAQLIVRSRNLVLACGSYASVPSAPVWPSASAYTGATLHGAAFRSSRQWSGKRGIVVGTANTAHDVAEDMLQHGMQVTMVQRGHTFVYPAEWLHAAQDLHYNADVLPDRGDRLGCTLPNKILREIVNFKVHEAIGNEPQRFDALEKAGFKLERYGDIYDNLYNRFGGHYVDIGTSAKIASGQITMVSSPVKEWTETGLSFENGKTIDAEVVVMCTGFEHDFRSVARGIVGDAADDMEEYFGLDAEGEIRGAFKRAGHPALYYTGGDIRQCRFFSRFIALQIQANVLGLATEQYLDSPQ